MNVFLLSAALFVGSANIESSRSIEQVNLKSLQTVSAGVESQPIKLCGTDPLKTFWRRYHLMMADYYLSIGFDDLAWHHYTVAVIDYGARNVDYFGP